MTKVTYRIPLDPYAFIEYEHEYTDTVSPETIKDDYDTLTEAMKAKTSPGLPDKEFNAWIDNYLVNQTGNADKYKQMNPEQVNTIQAIKRSLARIKTKLPNNEIE